MQRLRQLTREIYRLTAPNYETAIGPIMAPLAHDLATSIPIAEHATLLDIGTGTGFVLRAIASPTRRTIGIDLSYQMLHAARSLQAAQKWPRASFLQADAHDLSFLQRGSVDAVLSSFGLGESQPDQSLRSIRHILRPGGRLALQEWGPYDVEGDPRALVDATLAEFITDTADTQRTSLRTLLDTPLPWQHHLQDTEDYTLALEEAGFRQVMAREYRPVTLKMPASTFLDYALAWAPRALEVAALSSSERKQFRTTALENLQATTDLHSNLAFSPIVFRATATC